MTLQQLSTSIRPLNKRTPAGLFVTGQSGPTYWVMDNDWGQFAVQLNEAAGRPAFSFHELDERPAAMGLWLGSVELELGQEDETNFVKKCGIVVARDLRLYLKVNGPDGLGMRLIIPRYTLDERLRWSEFYSQWSLKATIAGRSTTVFESAPIPPVMRPYAADYFAGTKLGLALV